MRKEPEKARGAVRLQKRKGVKVGCKYPSLPYTLKKVLAKPSGFHEVKINWQTEDLYVSQE